MRRFLAGALLLSLLTGLQVSVATAVPGTEDLVTRLGVDVQKAQEALRLGAEEVGAPPAEAAAYFQDRPLQWFHPTQDMFTHTQPNGTSFAAQMLEFTEGGGQVTDSGHLVTKGVGGWWYYGVRQADGTIEATSAMVGHSPAPAEALASNRPAEFVAALAEHNEYAAQLDAWFASRAAAQMRAAAAAGEPLLFKVPALMLAINNEPFQAENTAEVIEAKYTGIGTSPTGTVTEMYLEQSFGNLLVQVDVYGPYDSVISNNPVNDCWYGTDGGPVLGEQLGLGGYGAKGLALEAVPMADPEVDFAQYDGDGDNYVDFLMIVHSGRGAETTGDPCDVHSHRFGGLLPALVDGAPAEPTPLSADGVLIGQALTVPEIDAGIGVVAHELMHAFGEPDYYGTVGNSGTGDWDLGGGGSYGGVPTQSSPLHFNPVMKVDFGWVEPTIIRDTTLDLELRPRASYPDLAMVPVREIAEGEEGFEFCNNDVLNTGQNQVANFIVDGKCLVEGFFLEHLSPTSAFADAEQCVYTPADFDRQMYDTGVMIWHWDLSSYVQLGNNNVLRPMLDIEEFDRRDGRQELETGYGRAEPGDLFSGDPVGISSATLTLPEASATLDPPAGSPYTVTAPPATAGQTEAWQVPADAQDGTIMRVTLDWGTSAVDDWDLAVQKQVGEEWIEAGTSGAAPASGPEIVELTVEPGASYRAEGVNYASVSTTATVTVEYLGSAEPTMKFGSANTTNADFEPTGWQFTNIRPLDYAGFATGMQSAATIATLDLIKHDETTVDVSGDFLTAVTEDEWAQPIVAGSPVTLQSRIYNHGGKTVEGAQFRIFDGNPSDGGTELIAVKQDLDGFGQDVIEVEFTPVAGLNELYVTASADGDLVEANNIVRTELVANPSGDASVLVIDNDHGWTQEETVAANLMALGVPFHVVDGEPDAATMADYDASILLTMGVSGAPGVLSPAGWDEVTAYLDGGGNFWAASNRLSGYAAHEQVGRGESLTEYFGVVGINNILDPMGDSMVGQGDDIGGTREIEMTFIDGRPYLDYFDLAESSHGSPVGLFVHPQRPDNLVGAKLDGGSFRTVISPALTGLAHGVDQVELTQEVLSFFGITTGSADPSDTRVAFNRFQHVLVGDDWDIVVGAPSADLVQFNYRIHGDDEWTSMGLDEVTSGLFGGTIPVEDVTNNGLDYYVTVADGGVTRAIDGGADLPNVASGTYGDPADVDFGVCAAGTVAPGDGTGTGDDNQTPTPVTGGGLTLAAFAALTMAGATRRRRA